MLNSGMPKTKERIVFLKEKLIYTPEFGLLVYFLLRTLDVIPT